jgi:uncharacterized protein YkwD
MLSSIVIPHDRIKTGMDTTTTTASTDEYSTDDTSSNSSDHSFMKADSTKTLLSTNKTTKMRPIEIALKRAQSNRNLQALPPKRSTTSRLPDTDYYSSNHILVNRERVLRGLGPLQRCRHLDDLAAVHAQDMANQLTLFQSGCTADVQYRLKSRLVGENVQCGPDIRAMHHTSMSMHGHTCRTNILSKQLNQFGMATAKGEDGYLYMVQLFRHVNECRF